MVAEATKTQPAHFVIAISVNSQKLITWPKRNSSQNTYITHTNKCARLHIEASGGSQTMSTQTVLLYTQAVIHYSQYVILPGIRKVLKVGRCNLRLCFAPAQQHLLSFEMGAI